MDNAVIAAGAVVTRDVPANSIADIADGSLDYHRIGIEKPVIEIEGDRAGITFTSVLDANAYNDYKMAKSQKVFRRAALPRSQTA